MLAQSFKTAEELGLSDEEFAAHVTVLGMLERGELKHEPYPTRHTVGNAFNMNYDGSANHGPLCGTVACIGGWVATILGRPMDEYVQYPLVGTARCDLYYPHTMGDEWDEITPAQASIALRSYLTTGFADWAEAMS